MEHVAHAGSIPAEFELPVVTFDFAFVENAGEIEECTGTIMTGRYDPRPTVLPTPAGECRTFGDLTVDLAERDGSHSLGTHTVERRFGTGHALVVRDVVATYENGTRVRRIHDTDFGRVVTFASGRFGLRIGVTEESADREWKYNVVAVGYPQRRNDCRGGSGPSVPGASQGASRT